MAQQYHATTTHISFSKRWTSRQHTHVILSIQIQHDTNTFKFKILSHESEQTYFNSYHIKYIISIQLLLVQPYYPCIYLLGFSFIRKCLKGMEFNLMQHRNNFLSPILIPKYAYHYHDYYVQRQVVLRNVQHLHNICILLSMEQH